jgi:hypothetical protein
MVVSWGNRSTSAMKSTCFSGTKVSRMTYRKASQFGDQAAQTALMASNADGDHRLRLLSQSVGLLAQAVSELCKEVDRRAL